MTDINNSGPAYPPGPAAGSNGIGKFAIGVSPVGDIPRFNFWRTVASQYANAPILTGIIERFNDAADPTALFEAFYDDVWNIATAQDYGLDIWGRIVGVNRVLQLPTQPWFGFANELPGALSWNTGVSLFNGTWVETNQNQGGGSFFSGQPLTSNFRLETESYRTLILAKAAFNITSCSIPSINQLLLHLFPNRGNAFVTDGFQGGSWFGFAESQNAQPFGQAAFYNGQTIQTMVMSYVFEFPLTPVELAIVQQSGVLPKPTGVQASVVINA